MFKFPYRLAPVDMFWGERLASVSDSFGLEWGIETKTKEKTSDEIETSAAAIFKKMKGYIICKDRHLIDKVSVSFWAIIKSVLMKKVAVFGKPGGRKVYLE